MSSMNLQMIARLLWSPGELPYEEYTGACHFLDSNFQGKIPKRVCQFFGKISERVIVEEIPDRVSYFDDTNNKPKEDQTD